MTRGERIYGLVRATDATIPPWEAIDQAERDLWEAKAKAVHKAKTISREIETPRRRGYKAPRWTDEENAMIASDATARQISDATGRTISAVRMRRWRLNRRSKHST